MVHFYQRKKRNALSQPLDSLCVSIELYTTDGPHRRVLVALEGDFYSG